MPTKIRGFLLIRRVLRLIFALFIKGVLVLVIALVLVIVIELPDGTLALVVTVFLWLAAELVHVKIRTRT